MDNVQFNLLAQRITPTAAFAVGPTEKPRNDQEGMSMSHLQRRGALLGGGAAAGILLLKQHRFALAAQTEERVIPWVDQPPPVPPPAQGAIHNLTPWERLDSWITPNERFFYIDHY